MKHLLVIFLLFVASISFGQTQDKDSIALENAIFDFCRLLKEQRPYNEHISAMLYSIVQKEYPGTSLTFYVNKCDSIYEDKKILNGLWEYYSAKNLPESYLQMHFIQIGLSATNSEIIGKYIYTKEYMKNE